MLIITGPARAGKTTISDRSGRRLTDGAIRLPVLQVARGLLYERRSEDGSITGASRTSRPTRLGSTVVPTAGDEQHHHGEQ